MATDLLEGEILEQHRGIVDAEKHKKPGTDPTTDESCSLPAACSQGCGESSNCTTDERKKKYKKEHEKAVAGWFDPPAARR